MRPATIKLLTLVAMALAIIGLLKCHSRLAEVAGAQKAGSAAEAEKASQSKAAGGTPTESLSVRKEAASRGPSQGKTGSNVAYPTNSRDRSADSGANINPLDDVQLESQIDYQVAGRPFPISESVKGNVLEDTFPEERERISRFTEEPRDMAWAPVAEKLLRSLVDSRSPDYRARKVECRETVCLMEVESQMGMWNIIPPSKDRDRGDVMPLTRVFARERMNSGASLIVTFWIYDRASRQVAISD